MAAAAELRDDYGAFMEKFQLLPPHESSQLPLHGLTFAVKDIFDIDGYVTGFGNPDWAGTHAAATSTAPSVMALLAGGATCIGKTVMDEMAYSMMGENAHYGTPTNPCAPDRVPGGSSSGSSVAVAAGLADFSLGTDTGASVRVPAAFCGILGFRPSHGVVSTDGVIPMSQSFDTVGWFSRDPQILSQVGHVLLQLPKVEPVPPSRVIIADDCFHLLNIPSERITHVLIKSIEKLFGYEVIHHTKLGDYVKDKVPSLNHFMDNYSKNQEYSIPSIMALSNALLYLQRYEVNVNHGEWVRTVKPDLGPGISEIVWEAVRTTGEKAEVCREAMSEHCSSLGSLLEGYGILAIPTVPGPPPKLLTEAIALESYCTIAFSLLSIAGMSGFCQVSIPLGMYNGLPVAVSLVARHGSDGFLLNLVNTIYDTLKEQAEIAEKLYDAGDPGKLLH